MAGEAIVSRSRLRVMLRWLLFSVLSVLLLVVGLFVWLNFLGVPQFAREQIRNEFRGKNLEVEFDKLRLAGFSRLIADNFRFRDKTSSEAVLLHIPRAELQLDSASLRRFQLEPSVVYLRNASMAIPLGGDSENPLWITNINTEVRFKAGDVWELTQFHANALGIETSVSAILTNGSRLMRLWPQRPPDPDRPSPWREHLTEMVRVLEKMRFSTPPRITVSLAGDGKNPKSLRLTLSANAQQGRSPWGSAESIRLLSIIHPSSSNLVGSFSLALQDLRADEYHLQGAEFRGETVWDPELQHLLTNRLSLVLRKFYSPGAQCETLTADLRASERHDGLIQAELGMTTSPLRVQDTRTGSTDFNASVVYSVPLPTPAVLWRSFLLSTSDTNSLPAPGRLMEGLWSFRSPELVLPRAVVQNVSVSGEVERAEADPLPAETGLWRSIQGLRIPWTLSLSNLFAENVNIGSLKATGLWESPRLTLAPIRAQLYGGELNSEATLDIISREVIASASGRFDYHKGALVLEKQVQSWLAQFAWEEPPSVQAKMRFTLPPWKDSWIKAEKKVLPSLHITGSLDGAGSFRGIEADQVRTSFEFTNFVWHLPDLFIRRPEGAAQLEYTGNVTNATFRCLLKSSIDPMVLKPLFSEEQQVVFEMLRFEQPPLFTGEAIGSWEDEQRIGFQGQLAVTNFLIKGTPFTDASARLYFTNSILVCQDVLVHRGTEEVKAPFLRLDFPREVMFVTNVHSTMNPYLSMKLVGPDIYDAIDPYRFATPPKVIVNGEVPLKHWSKANVHFQVDGQDFSFWKFRMPALAGDVYWKADHIYFSNVVANFYQGRGYWSGHFYVNDEHTTDFSFKARVERAELSLLLRDLVAATNYLEGKITGDLTIVQANSHDTNSWNGYGQAVVRDGVLWKVPVFGIFSPALDAIIPGESVSRITEAEGSFTLTNSVVYTKDLQVRAPAFRLNYEGQVDLEGNIAATVEAEIFRDLWLVGRAFSFALWPVSKAFQAKVGGTLTNPKSDLRHFPKLLFAPGKLFRRNTPAQADEQSP